MSEHYPECARFPTGWLCLPACEVPASECCPVKEDDSDGSVLPPAMTEGPSGNRSLT